MTIHTWSSASSGSSTNHSHDKRTHMSSIIEETELIKAESEKLLEEMLLAKGKEQVRAGLYSGNKWNFLKRAPAVPASKLVIEYPATLERKVLQTTPKAEAATKIISSQVTDRREKKPAASAQGQKHSQDETSSPKRLMKELKMMEAATARANIFQYNEEIKRINAQLALEKVAEKIAQREAHIIMKNEKQEIQRELKAAAKERKRLLIRQRAEEKVAKITEAKMKKEQLKKRRKEEEMAAMKADLRIALALAKGRKARKTKEAGYSLTAYQKKTQRGHDMPNYQKKTRSARFLKNEKTPFADFSVLEHARDDDLSRIKDECIQWKRQLPLHDKEEREEAEGVGTIERIFQCGGSHCALLPMCANANYSLYEATSEKESRHRRVPQSRPFARPRSNKPSLGSRSKSPNLRKPGGQNNTRPRRQQHKQHHVYRKDS